MSAVSSGSSARQRNGKAGASPFPGTEHDHRAAVQFDQMADDGQTQSQAGVTASRRGVGLPKSFEDMGQKLERNALAGVADFDFDVGVGLGQPGLHAARP